MWSLANSHNDESSKIRWELVPYFYGRVLDIGCGPYKAFPHFIGVDSGQMWGGRGIDVRVEDGAKLELFASQSCDTVYSSHLLEHIEDYRAALREWWRVIKPHGHLCLYLPHKGFYPNIGQEGANPDHKHDFIPADIIAVMQEIGSCDLLVNEERNQADEYSFFQVYRKLPGRGVSESWKLPKPEKTAAIVRYGAIGDALQTSSLFPALKEQGYHVTLYCQAGPGYEVLKHDPNVDQFIIQGKDQIPPQFLQEFWDHTKKKYDRWINLCESIEGTLLAIPGRPNHEWPNEARAKFMDRNYLEWTHELAQVPPPYRVKFFSTTEEKQWARRTIERWGRAIMWSLSGSSGHKVWPHLDEVLERILVLYPDVHVVLVGDEFCRVLESGWDKHDNGVWRDAHPRIHCKSGKWTIRESMAFAEVATLIVGTETGVLNGASAMDTPKIITLSHSSKEMLTKHWKNALVLEQPQGVGCNKSPCRQLHYTWDYCPKHEESGTALCQYHITTDMMWNAIKGVLQ